MISGRFRLTLLPPEPPPEEWYSLLCRRRLHAIASDNATLQMGEDWLRCENCQSPLLGSHVLSTASATKSSTPKSGTLLVCDIIYFRRRSCPGSLCTTVESCFSASVGSCVIVSPHMRLRDNGGWSEQAAQAPNLALSFGSDINFAWQVSGCWWMLLLVS